MKKKVPIGICVPCTSKKHTECSAQVSILGCKCGCPTSNQYSLQKGEK